MPRRSTRLQQAECNALSERASKRQRQEKPTTEVNTSRAPLSDVSNSTIIVTRAKSRLQQSAKPTQKAHKRARSTGKTKNETGYRLPSKPLSRAKAVPVTRQMKGDASRTSALTRAVQEADIKRIGREDGSENLVTYSSEQGRRSNNSSSAQMKSTQARKQSEADPTVSSYTKTTSRDPSSSPAIREPKENSAGNSLSQPIKRGHLKPSRRSPSPPPLYPEDEIQPVPTPSKVPRQEGHSKRPPRPPSPPPLYPDDEIQPLPPKVKKKPSYGMRTAVEEVTASVIPERKLQVPRFVPSIPFATSRQPPTLPTSSSPLEHEDEIGKPSLLDELSTAEHVTQSNPRIQIVKPSSESPNNSQRTQRGRSAVNADRAQTPEFRSEMEEQSTYRSQIRSKAPAPIHTYSKRRQNVQNLALPSRKSLGVRSRTSGGESPDSKDDGAYDSQSDQSDDDEESGDSEPEESDREDPALVSFIGQQRKLWDEIDKIDLEEDLM